MDKYLMDGNKMLWHLDRVVAWEKGERIAPLHIDVGLSKGCNIRCHYCFGALQDNKFDVGQKKIFPREALLRYVKDAGTLGVRSMAFIGEAEPTINLNIYDAVVEGKRSGVDIAIGTNGVLFDDGLKGQAALEHLTWLRFNIGATTDESYKRLHGSDQFLKFLAKVRFCVEYKRRNNLDVTLGFQMVLTPQNADQVVGLAKMGRDMGVDYLVVKQCSDSVDNELGVYKELGEYGKYEEVLLEAESYSNDDYDVIVKWGKIGNQGRRSYASCLGAPFLLYSSGDGRLYPCGMFFEKERGEEDFRLGDLTQESFIDILHSDRYWDVMQKVSELDVSKCYTNCKTHSINEFVWKIKKERPGHVNFV